MAFRYKKYKLSEHKFTVFALGASFALLAIILLVGDSNVAVLNPKGWIAFEQRKTLITSILLMLIVVVPVYFMTFWISRKYNEANTEEKYAPDAVNDAKTQIILWLIPSVVIALLAAVMWKSSHKLDPFKPIASAKAPITIQVVALQWKWLFIYPELNVATVNFIQMPEDTPIKFELTSDAPMNSFWIPSLGGQMYAMPGMSTELNLIADETGDYLGSAAEINGRGFSGMKFVARASSEAEFDAWIESVRRSQNILTSALYDQLRAPTENHSQLIFADVETGLYNKIMNKFMPMGDASHMGHK